MSNPTPSHISASLRFRLREQADPARDSWLEAWDGGQQAGRIVFRPHGDGLLCMWSVSVTHLRCGVGIALTDELRRRYPGRALYAHRADENTVAGNAFIAAYNRKAGKTLIRPIG